MDEYVFQAADETATDRLGAALADLLPGGSVVALCGTLGAGKTRLVQAIAAAAGVERRSVVSPTFVLMQQYQGRRPIYHLDAYRLRDEDEFAQLGPEEFFEGDGLTFIEWADRVQGCLPRERLEIEIEVTGPETRRFVLRAHGEPYATIVGQLRTLLTGEGDLSLA